jgi:hypothetical protein
MVIFGGWHCWDLLMGKGRKEPAVPAPFPHLHTASKCLSVRQKYHICESSHHEHAFLLHHGRVLRKHLGHIEVSQGAGKKSMWPRVTSEHSGLLLSSTQAISAWRHDSHTTTLMQTWRFGQQWPCRSFGASGKSWAIKWKWGFQKTCICH